MGDLREFNGYRSQAAALAMQALKLAPDADVTPTSLLHVRPVAMTLAGDKQHDAADAITRFTEALLASHRAGRPLRVTDPAGHWRDIYLPLAMHLYLRRTCHTGSSEAFNSLAHAVKRAVASDPTSMPMALWQATCLKEAGHDLQAVGKAVELALSQSGDEGELHAMTAADSLDAWTYRELIAIHALVWLCRVPPALPDAVQLRAEARLITACEYHLMNTQPDHVTTQPWGLPAFALHDATRPFAEQQLHDATTQVALARGRPVESHAGGGAYVAGLLLADASHLLSLLAR